VLPPDNSGKTHFFSITNSLQGCLQYPPSVGTDQQSRPLLMLKKLSSIFKNLKHLRLSMIIWNNCQKIKKTSKINLRSSASCIVNQSTDMPVTCVLHSSKRNGQYCEKKNKMNMCFQAIKVRVPSCWKRHGQH